MTPGHEWIPGLPFRRGFARSVSIHAAVVVVAVAGCAGGSPKTESLTVFAASSLTSSFTRLGADFERSHPGTRVTFSFGSSSALAQQVLAGAPADVFASASTKSMSQVATEVGPPTAFASNVAEIAAAPSAHVRALADLARVRVALCDVSVPCGAVAEQVLGEAHLVVHPVTRGLDARGTLGYVVNGSVDAAIVYVTDVLSAGDRVRGVEIPAALNATTEYDIATVRGSQHSALAQAFVDFVLSPQGRAALTAAGFRRP
jgi:molybdate transport system substrate-binding protein